MRCRVGVVVTTHSLRLGPDFGDSVALESVAVRPEQLYRKLIAAERNPNFLYPGYRFIRDLVDRTPVPDALAHLVDAEANVAGLAQGLLDWALASELPVPESTRPGDGHIRLQEFSPLGLLDGCWLQGATALTVAEIELGVNIQEQHKLWARGDVRAEMFGAPFRAIVQDLFGRAVECYDESFITDCGIAPHSFEHALVGLSLGQFPSTFLPEIVGYGLWQACVGPSFPCRAPEEGGARAQARQLAYEAVGLAVLGAVGDGQNIPARIARGFVLAGEAYRRWEEAVTAVLSQRGPASSMLRLLERKGRFAVGYHKDIRLNGVSIDDFLGRGEEGCRALMEALAASRYVRRGEPGRSRLLNVSISLRGPMFEVFSAEEVTIIEDWIVSLDGTGSQSEPVVMPELAGLYEPAQDASDMAIKSEERFARCDVAELAFYFANADIYPIVRPYSAKVAARVAAALRAVSRASVPETAFSPYSLPIIDALLEDLRIRQLDGFENDETPPQEGKALVDAYLGGYPSVCTDGSWLQGCANVAHFHHEANQILFCIYREENGDGDFEQNHNLIGRRLLASMGGRFPPLTSSAFYKHDGVQASFFGPCCNLALSLNTQQFMPEVLGLNLAIEANGVGWKFRKGAQELRAAGFDPLLMDIHETIDNFASGHTAMSKRAIVSYLERAANFDEAVVQGLWARIWHAYQGVQGLIENRDHPDVQQAVKTVARGNVENARNLGGTLIDVVAH